MPTEEQSGNSRESLGGKPPSSQSLRSKKTAENQQKPTTCEGYAFIHAFDRCTYENKMVRDSQHAESLLNRAVLKNSALVQETLSVTTHAHQFLQGVHCAIVTSDEINAWATNRANVYSVSFTTRLVQTIIDMFLTLLSHPRVLPFIGTVDKNQACPFSSLPAGFGLRGSGPHDSGLYVLFTPHKWPGDNQRFNAALDMGMMSLSFIFGHELGHILYDHLEYLRLLRGVSYLPELGDRVSQTGLQPSELQVMEYEADGLGSICTLHPNLLGEYFRLDDSVWQRNPITKEEYCYYIWGFSVTATQYLFAQQEQTIEDHRDRTHPHPQLRMHNNWYSAMKPAAALGSTLGKKAVDAVGAGMHGAVRLWKEFAIPGWKYDLISPNGSASTVSRELAAVAKAIASHRDRISRIVLHPMGPQLYTGRWDDFRFQQGETHDFFHHVVGVPSPPQQVD